MIAITGGGTGGHLAIARCLLQSAKKQGLECIYIGSENGQDKLWFEQELAFHQRYFLSSSGVVNKKGLSKISSFAHIIKLALNVKKILKKHEVKAVFSVGGYSSAPASFAALMANIPLLIHEQNSKIGSLNLLLKPFSKAFFTAFDDQIDKKNTFFCPYPVNEVFIQKARIRQELKSIIFLGGSQGAKFINDLALKNALYFKEKGINIIHQCGKSDYERCKSAYESMQVEVDLFDFDKNIIEKISKADLAVSRSGASSLFELSANKLPCIFIPYPYAAKNHQYFNALYLKERNLCEILTQDCEDDFIDIINNFPLKQISSRLCEIENKNGADFMLYKAKELGII
ncbi:UDP-N-acetylglucosamine--N-acetylmuramyl-(pentapeptide) pyrophosphoryl-undecaprenol N-acetylglucosamine transferase [Campylobacter lari]|nr:UDP-N-acetylglucosamine--N-acetylmuramyl-(pentapeptide) pyrophosphoryl-undecaprenol N-acetylglucosamine transferase [Campylobacter lari]ECL7011325.1 UDP-N-acetylglucosamine--N-acetylmuramyl-(pentapeptide) pyrophosphoryl-undecaprenol N-acetylglucosamine transferase [Campylobacter lari]EDC2881494.1 UDP-N-acetylglucosamine--N-acetylmuramyl-(pentapeptide) pyrophosphoryl-undecaprenol N-acetylglucosamine transferase [Campylobacter lari]MCV3550177.1 UDP-N-acetylglucosamine--N-acetylmuramyl-(pentapep